MKFEVLEQLKSKMETTNTLKLDGLTVKFCGKNEDPPTPEAHCFPIMIHTCPDDFSTLDYFDVSFAINRIVMKILLNLFLSQSLKTEHVGRLLVYSKVLAESMVLLNKVKYSHGFAVIPRELTGAVGRGNNKVRKGLKFKVRTLTSSFFPKWLSPEGCLMFSLQLHVPMSSPLGQKIPLIQHLIAVSVVLAVRTLPGYEVSVKNRNLVLRAQIL